MKTIPEESDEFDELEETELDRGGGFSGGFGLGLEAAVFMAVSLGGGGVHVWSSSLSLLLSGLNILLVFNFFSSESNFGASSVLLVVGFALD